MTDNTTSPATITTTDYINGFVYQNDSLQFFPTEEGRVRYVPAHGTTAAAYVYDYFIKDHLGNTRVVLTEQTDFTQYLATMEQQNAQTEDALFANVDNTREAKPLDYPEDNTTTPNTAVARLNGGDPDKRIGPSIILKVMAGDTIEAAVRAFYRQQATAQNNAGVPAEEMAASLMQALSLPVQAAARSHAVNPQARLAAPTSGLTSNDLNDLKNKDPQNKREDKPKAYLNYVFFDNQFNFVEDGSGVKQVDSDPNQLEILSSGKVVAKKDGYLYAYTSNESSQDVLFDNFGIMGITGPVLEETHYYPFGLTMAGISSTAPLKIENRFKFNGKELNHKEFSDGAGLDWYSYGMREYDPQIGRFFRVDPIAQKYPYYSPYQFAGNKVPNAIDLDGLEEWYTKDGHLATGISGPYIQEFMNRRGLYSYQQLQQITRHNGLIISNDDRTVGDKIIGNQIATENALMQRRYETEQGQWFGVVSGAVQAASWEYTGIKIAEGIRALSFIPRFERVVTGSLKIQTPYGIAEQSFTTKALAARLEIQNGAKLYRIGIIGKSETYNAQFWSLENPVNIKDVSEFAQKYGIPEANLKNGRIFMETGQLNQGEKFITREAPGVGKNNGGAIELVTNPNSVRLETFSTINFDH